VSEQQPRQPAAGPSLASRGRLSARSHRVRTRGDGAQDELGAALSHCWGSEATVVRYISRPVGHLGLCRGQLNCLTRKNPPKTTAQNSTTGSHQRWNKNSRATGMGGVGRCAGGTRFLLLVGCKTRDAYYKEPCLGCSGFRAGQSGTATRQRPRGELHDARQGVGDRPGDKWNAVRGSHRTAP
jgi:hypothetical protein